MNIVVTVKQVIDPNLPPSYIDLDPSGKRIISPFGVPPVMNGYEVAKRLRQEGTSAHLVALTGYGQPEDEQRAKDAGFDAHMIKPVDIERVLEALSD